MSFHSARQKVSGLFILFCLGLVLCGCSDGFMTAGKEQNETKVPAQEMVASAVNGRKELRSMTASATVRILDRSRDFSLTVNADILAESPACLRMRADKVGGAVDVFDLVVVDEDLAFYVPRKHAVYQGTLQDLKNLDEIKFDPKGLLTHILKADRTLLNRKWKKSETRKGRFAFFSGNPKQVLEEVHEKGREYYRLTFEDGLLAKTELMNSAGKATLVKTYGRYKGFFGRTDKLYPYRTKIEWPLRKNSIEVSFKQIKPNSKIDEDAFGLEVPEDVKIKEISKIEIEAD